MPVVGLAKRWTFYVGKDGTVLFIDKEVKVDTAGADPSSSAEQPTPPTRTASATAVEVSSSDGRRGRLKVAPGSARMA